MCSRSIEEITGILKSAKLSVDELLPLSQEIRFDADFSGSDLRLLELDKEVEDAIRVGDRLVIRGEEEDYAVLCTKNSSFEMKNVDTSNSLLIFKQLSLPSDMENVGNLLAKTGPDAMVIDEGVEMDGADAGSNSEPQLTNEGRNQFIGKRSILHVAHSYYELTKIKPNLSRIKRMLEPTSYNGPTEELEIDGNETRKDFITFDKLLDQIPGSENEIRDYITSNLRTFDIDGNIRLVGDDYLLRALSQVLDCIESYSWKPTEISKNVVVSDLSGLHPQFVLEKVFQWFFLPQTMETGEEGDAFPTGSANEGTILYSMNEHEISRFLGMIILKAGGKFTYSDFVLAWADSVPQGLKVNLKHLEGLAVTDAPEGSPLMIWYFPESTLPETIPERFQALFAAKSKWKQDDIMPYLECISVSAQSASGLLTKHARVYNAGGIKYCCSKHGK